MSPSDAVQAYHQTALDDRTFLVQHCGACERFVYYPRVLCPHCGAADLAWKAPSGMGTVHAVTTVRRRPEDGGDLNVSIIELDEGVRLMSRVCDLPPEQVRIGGRVRARVELQAGRGLVVFDSAEERAQ